MSRGMAILLAGLPVKIPGSTMNRLCGSGLDAVGTAARAIRAGDAHLMLAGGVESMSRAPFVIGKATEAFLACRQNRGHHARLALHQQGAASRLRHRQHG